MIPRVLPLLGFALVFACRATASVDPAEASRRFGEAGAAYDEGRYQDAVAAYQSLLEDGRVSPALLYNLGNAWYRAGDPGQAVLHYRRAGRLAPRDGDVRANLSYVLAQADAVAPPQPPLHQALRLVSRGEWAALAVATFWLLAVLLSLAFFSPRARTAFRRTALPGLLALFLAMLGLWAWSQEQAGRERVVLSAGQQTRFAPLEDAQPHFDVPPGSIVTFLEADGNWIKIAVGEKTGWLKAGVCAGISDVPYL